MIWTPCSAKNPDRDGIYIVTTARGRIRFDRFIGGVWGMCNPDNKRGLYKNHLAWAYMPEPYKDTKRIK